MDRPWQILLVTSVAAFMGFLDVTIVNIAFPNLRAIRGPYTTTPQVRTPGLPGRNALDRHDRFVCRGRPLHAVAR